MQEVIAVNAYLTTLENDIAALQELSSICRGEWCRFLESEVDTLQDELIEFRITEDDFERAWVEEMSTRIRDAYKHLASDVHIG